jgi:translation initiation factor IF-3
LKINREIRAASVRVINMDGEQLGVITLAEALAEAAKAGLDLVEVSPTAAPPVCRIMDYGKFRYQQRSPRRARQSFRSRRSASDPRPRNMIWRSRSSISGSFLINITR